MFVPLILHVLGNKLKEQVVFYTSVISIAGAFYFAFIAKIDKLPVFDMYSALYGVFVPFTIYFVYKLLSKEQLIIQTK